jgi:hypothetical protein
MMYKMGKHVMLFFVLISKVFYKILLENGVEIKWCIPGSLAHNRNRNI